ncbi:MAG TPA: DUF4390 domain-containing protein [Gallionellaceae bacterium]|nr:DUF4390 domain-containing protein [Gallionellaceae bacterium]
MLAILVLGVSAATADGIAVRKAEIRMTDEGYQLAANFDIRLSILIEQALTHGITLNFTSEFTLTRSRWYWLDEVAAQTEQTTKLSYSALTRQYRIKRGTLFQNFANLDDALRALGNQSSEPIPAELLNKNSGYIASLLKSNANFTAFARMKLDVTQLPKPLQVNALTSDEWKLDSEGYSWMLAPAEIAQARKELQ